VPKRGDDLDETRLVIIRARDRELQHLPALSVEDLAHRGRRRQAGPDVPFTHRHVDRGEPGDDVDRVLCLCERPCHCEGDARGHDAAALIDAGTDFACPSLQQRDERVDRRQSRRTLLAIARAADHEPGFVEIVAALRHAITADEFAAPLAPAVSKAFDDSMRLIGPSPSKPPSPSPAPPPPAPPGVSIVRGQKLKLTPREARAELERLAGDDGEVLVDLSWTVTTRTDT